MNESNYISRFGGGRPQGRGGNNWLNIPKALWEFTPLILSLGALYYSYNSYKNMKGPKGDTGPQGPKGDPGDPAYLFPVKKIDKFISDNNITDDNSAINFLMKYCSLSKEEAESKIKFICDDDGKIDRREASLLMLIKLNHDVATQTEDPLLKQIIEDFKNRYHIDGTIDSVKNFLINERGFSEKEAEEEIKLIDLNQDGKFDNREIAQLMCAKHKVLDPRLTAFIEDYKLKYNLDGSIESAKKFLMEHKNMTSEQADEAIEKINKDGDKKINDVELLSIISTPAIDTLREIIKEAGVPDDASKAEEWLIAHGVEKATAEKLIAEFDQDEDGKLTRAEQLRLLVAQKSDNDLFENALKLYKESYGITNDTNSIKQYLINERGFSEEAAEEAAKNADLNHDEHISDEELARIIWMPYSTQNVFADYLFDNYDGNTRANNSAPLSWNQENGAIDARELALFLSERHGISGEMTSDNPYLKIATAFMAQHSNTRFLTPGALFIGEGENREITKEAFIAFMKQNNIRNADDLDRYITSHYSDNDKTQAENNDQHEPTENREDKVYNNSEATDERYEELKQQLIDKGYSPDVSEKILQALGIKKDNKIDNDALSKIDNFPEKNIDDNTLKDPEFQLKNLDTIYGTLHNDINARIPDGHIGRRDFRTIGLDDKTIDYINNKYENTLGLPIRKDHDDSIKGEEFTNMVSADLENRGIDLANWKQDLYTNAHLLENNDIEKFNTKYGIDYNDSSDMNEFYGHISKIDDHYGFNHTNDEGKDGVRVNDFIKYSGVGYDDFTTSTLDFLKDGTDIISKKNIIDGDWIYGNHDGFLQANEAESMAIDRQYGNGNGKVTQEEINAAHTAGFEMKYHNAELSNNSSPQTGIEQTQEPAKDNGWFSGWF